MKKQMNEYKLQLNGDAPAFNTQMIKWVQEQGASCDLLRSETSEQAVNVVCTEEIARRVVEAFSGAVAPIRMDRENIITIPAPLQKKTRSPGFGTV